MMLNIPQLIAYSDSDSIQRTLRREAPAAAHCSLGGYYTYACVSIPRAAPQNKRLAAWKVSSAKRLPPLTVPNVAEQAA